MTMTCKRLNIISWRFSVQRPVQNTIQLVCRWLAGLPGRLIVPNGRFWQLSRNGLINARCVIGGI